MGILNGILGNAGEVKAEDIKRSTKRYFLKMKMLK